MENDDEVLNLIFKKCDNLKYEVDNEKIVTILEEQNRRIQKFFRKLKFKIPMYKKITFDEYCSEVFSLIDGSKTVEEIGALLEKKYGENVYPLYERLLVFLNHIYINCKYIEKI